jgi:hypothetical protein
MRRLPAWLHGRQAADARGPHSTRVTPTRAASHGGVTHTAASPPPAAEASPRPGGTWARAGPRVALDWQAATRLQGKQR